MSGENGRGPLVALNRLLPGLLLLRRRELSRGSLALAGWVGLWTLAVVRWGRVLATPRGGGTEEWIAFLTLFAALAGAWWLGNRGARTPAERGSASQAALAWRAFRRHRPAMLGLFLTGGLCLAVLLGPYLSLYDPNAQGDIVATRFLAPSILHPMGTDRFGRDVFSRVLHGARISLSIGVSAVFIAITLGTLAGAVAGYLRGWWDAVTMRFVDLMLSFPRLVLLIAVAGLFRPSILLVVLVLGLTGWMGTSRIVRGEVLSLREREFVQAARALGYSEGRILLRHVLPNVWGPVIVAATLGIGNTILAEAALSFLSLGVQPPTASWGNMVASGRDVMLDAWWITTFPGLAIVFTVMSFNLVGDGLRDALDPRRAGR
ncbi:MAG: ABC transporter permease [Gemmatimonadota bacterium]